MRILVLGGDGYLGWPTAMHFSQRGDEVCIVDNFAKRQWEMEEGIEPLWSVSTLHRRVKTWENVSGKKIEVKIGDLCNHRFVYAVFEAFKPDAIVHYGEQPSAPYSMQSREAAVYTQHNNVVGNLNVMFAMQKFVPNAHLIKLGTMGEYGTPNIDIEEGWLEIEHKGRKDRVLYPKKPGSYYHLSKVHDSANLEFACRIWGMKATDLNQGVVYGVDTDQTVLHDDLRTSFHYDDIFGTVLNRFLSQAAVGRNLTVYGNGTQTRGFLNIKDTIACVALAADNSPEQGEFRIFNQFTEQFSVLDLATKVQASALRAGLDCKVDYLANPRVEQENHYYNAVHTGLVELGLQPTLLTDDVVDAMLANVCAQKDAVDTDVFIPRVKWKQS
ncbi:NAD-dependent epimerase/dehydratase family protein [Thalassospira lohafexi]|uniref:NAD-dependent dehydratase n=1 Tax=Thalassospira lohafexi TaxID=744227 RepID=A0A2N3LBB5_9PROT|nr:NAD-dependent epimerase/dehydratase family protein [Thalassospira lohafexi]PKR60058.1 NAD-dependent dehydratase [Thalassospira lohafexi]|tara:strand:- start:8281 stop:9435 length:1155 start_codon:yes stop_codon:yes gene_type:complete